MKFCCGITLFYPTEDELKSSLRFKDVFKHVYIYDNTEGIEYKRNEAFFKGKDGYTYISNNENGGLSLAFNVMCQRSIDQGFDYICLFDQDSSISNEDLLKIINYAKTSNINNVGIIAPKIVYNHLVKNKEIYYEDKIIISEVDWVISSGSFINLSVYTKTDGFDENYFIDRLDFDYCCTIREYGYKVIVYNNALLFQNLGEQRNFLFKKISQHNSVRHYYIFRNRLYFLLKKNDKSIKQIVKAVLFSFKHFLIILLFETKKLKKFYMIIRAFRDFTLSNMGKLNSNQGHR